MTTDRAPSLIHEETFCCGFKRCPVLRVFNDGTVEIYDTEDEAHSMTMSREQALALAEGIKQALIRP